MFNKYKYWKRNYESLQKNYYEKCSELNQFKEDVFEKESIKDLKEQLAEANNRIEVLVNVNRTLEDCNRTLTEVVKKQ